MTIDSELIPFIKGLEEAWPEPTLSLSVEQWRERAEKLSAAKKVDYPAGMVVKDIVVPGKVRDVITRMYIPESVQGKQAACLIYMHGGGWVIGSHETHDSITAKLANQANLIVLSVHYARAPEHPFPAPLDDCKQVLQWLFENAVNYHIDTQKIFTGGDSAGGNLATVLALLNKSGSEHAIRGQVLFYPCVDMDFTRSSYITEAQAPYLKAKEMIWFWHQYCPANDLHTDPFVTPINATDLDGMAPAIVLVAEHDPLYDDGCAYAEKLSAAGINTEFHPGKGLIHGYLRATDICTAAAKDFNAACAWLKRMSQ